MAKFLGNPIKAGRLRDALAEVPDMASVHLVVRINGIDYLAWLEHVELMTDPDNRAARSTVRLVSKSGDVV
jgi:hypothetical protein